MPVEALSIALVAAALHALWNLLLAGARDSEAATAVMLVVAVVLFAPVAAALWDVRPAAAPYLAGSAVLELSYFALLARAYRTHEMSLVYPLARGAAPVLVLLVSAVALGASIPALGTAGILLVAGGVVLLRRPRRAADARGVALALAIGGCIAGYTLLDKEGVAHADPIVYLELVSIGPALVYAAAVGRARGLDELRAALGPRTVVAGAGLFGAYALVLVALERAPAAPVAAVRESSVLFATVLAALVLRERVSAARAAGAALILAGIGLVALA